MYNDSHLHFIMCDKLCHQVDVDETEQENDEKISAGDDDSEEDYVQVSQAGDESEDISEDYEEEV